MGYLDTPHWVASRDGQDLVRIDAVKRFSIKYVKAMDETPYIVSASVDELFANQIELGWFADFADAEEFLRKITGESIAWYEGEW